MRKYLKIICLVFFLATTLFIHMSLNAFSVMAEAVSRKSQSIEASTPETQVGNLLGQVYDSWPVGGPEEAWADAWAGASDPSIATDDTGHATVKVAWQSACDSGGTEKFTFKLYVDGVKRAEKIKEGEDPDGSGHLSYTFYIPPQQQQYFEVKWYVKAEGDAWPDPAVDDDDAKVTLLVHNPAAEPSTTEIYSPESYEEFKRYEHVYISGRVIGSNTGLGAGGQVNVTVKLITELPYPPGYEPWSKIVQLTAGGYFEVDYFNEFEVPYPIANPKKPDPLGFYTVTAKFLGNVFMDPSTASVIFERVPLVRIYVPIIVNPIWEYENVLFYVVILEYVNTTYASPVPSADVMFNGVTKLSDALGNVRFRAPDVYVDPTYDITASKNGNTSTSQIDIRNREPPQRPVALFRLLDHPVVDQLIRFDGSLSYDRDGNIYNYAWNFGDGVYGNGESVTHSYPTGMSYSIMLNVTDDDGLSTTITKMIYVSSPGVGGIVVSVDKFALLAPYIALASTILVATVATAIYTKRVKRRKEKQ